MWHSAGAAAATSIFNMYWDGEDDIIPWNILVKPRAVDQIFKKKKPYVAPAGAAATSIFNIFSGGKGDNHSEI